MQNLHNVQFSQVFTIVNYPAVRSLLTEWNNESTFQGQSVINRVLRSFICTAFDCDDRAFSMLHTEFTYSSYKNPAEEHMKGMVLVFEMFFSMSRYSTISQEANLRIIKAWIIDLCLKKWEKRTWVLYSLC